MAFLFKRAHHLVRYFLIFGVLSFAGYILKWNNSVFLALNGPPIYLSFQIKSWVLPYLTAVQETETIDLYFFLMPVTLIYYTLVGFLLKQLWNERGLIRTLSLIALVGFLAYIHWKTWDNLTGYFTLPNG